MLAADINGDGRTDLVSAALSSIEIAISLGNGRFVNPSALAGAIQDTPVVADLGDGNQDVFIVGQNGDILWRKGQPGAPGSFTPPITINPGFPSRDIAFVPTQRGELLASVDLRDDAVSLYAYRGGQFIRVGSLATGTLPTEIVAGDLTGDGNSDLVVLDAGDGAAALYHGDGIGGFAGNYHIPLGLGASDIALANVDGSGHLDLVVTNQATGLVTVFPGTGAGAGIFGAPSTYPAGAGPYALDLSADGTTSTVTSDEATAGVAIGTFTQNGAPSLATIDPGTNTFEVLAGRGGGAFANPVGFLTSTPATVVRAAEFTGDGLSDLAVLGSDGVTIYLSDRAGRFRSSTPSYVGPDPTGLTVADVNGDGKPDLLIGNANGDVLVLLGNGNGTFQPYRRVDQNEALAVLPTSGPTPEFIFADQGLDRVVVTAGSQSSVLASPSTGILDPGAVQLADLNGDGIPDMIVVNSGGNNVLVYPGLSNGQFGPELNGGKGFFTGTDPVSVTVADVTGNGRLDLVVTDKGSNDVSILLNEPTANGGFTLMAGERLQAGFGPTSTVVQYVNGIPNILVSDGSANQVTLLPGVGNGFFNDQNARTFPVGINPVQIMVGNFTLGQGPEIVTINQGSNNVTLISDFGSNAPVFQDFPTGGLDPVAAVAGEFFGNGLESLIIANNGDGLFSLLGGTEGLQVEATLSNPELSEPTALVLAASTGNEVSFYATTAGLEAAFTLAFLLPGPPPVIPGGPAQLFLLPLNESSLALVGTLLTVVLDIPTNATLTITAEDQAAVSSSVVAAPSFGQDPDTPGNNDEPGSDEGVESQAANPVAQGPIGWSRFILSIDKAFDRIRNENQDALFPDGDGVDEDEVSDQLSGTPRHNPAQVSPPVDRITALAVDEAIGSHWAVAPTNSGPSLSLSPELANPAPQVEQLPDDPSETRSGEPVSFWVPLLSTTWMVIHASPLTRPRRDRLRVVVSPQACDEEAARSSFPFR